MDNFKVNRNIFSSKTGVLGRTDYFKTIIGPFIAMYPISFFFAGVFLKAENFAGNFLLQAALLVASSFVLMVAELKRLRDIRGTDSDELVWKVLLFFGTPIPLVNLVISLVLMLLPGKITNADSSVTFGQGKKEPHATGADIASQVAKLYDLHKSGALTQEEFDSEKRKLLQRAG